MARGDTWFRALTAEHGEIETGLRSVRAADSALYNRTVCFLTVVPNPTNRFPRARNGEVGLDEGWSLAAQVRRVMALDHRGERRPIIALVDVVSQAYGWREEMLGIHLACAAAADAYAAARLTGHPVIALLVGKAMSGAFLAHGYQANRILALDSPEVMVHAMSKQSVARVTRRSIGEIEQLGRDNVPMAYDVHSFARLGLLYKLIGGVDADSPSSADVERVRRELHGAIEDALQGARDLSSRLTSAEAQKTRAASLEVRLRLAKQWDVG
jgi:biotin-independent malonate decarboxylase gamma subunit